KINGVENMLYMSSTSDDNGSYQLTITFNVGTDKDIAQVKVQNRLQQVMSQLPTAVIQEGVDVNTRSSNMLAMLVLRSPKGTYNDLFLSNYAYTNIKDILSRISGIGDVSIYGPQYSMRVWLNPQKLSSLGLSSSDIATAIENQNIQASIGSIGSAPSSKDTLMVLSLNAKGLLNTVEDFEQIILTTTKEGGIIRLRDVARVELGANTYTMQAHFDNAPAVVIALSQLPDSNSLEIMKNVQKELQNLRNILPQDIEISIGYDSTNYVKASIAGIIETLAITFILVVLVTYIFLQSAKTTMIPLITIPVSLVATFAVIYLLGFDINILTLFAMILAIGLVVDDAIIVVERVQYLMQYENLDSKTASIKGMQQIAGAIIATTFVLLSIFVPVGLMAGITGKIYQQFAVTISTAIVFSAFNALTLSPALCAIFLRNDKQKEARGFFKWFNNTIDFFKNKYLQIVGFFSKNIKTTIVVTLVVISLIIVIFKMTANSFLPEEDQGIIFANIQLTDTATINQTNDILSEITSRVLKIDGVKYFISVAGYSMLGGSGENVALGVVGLEAWDERTSKNLSVEELSKRLAKTFADMKNSAEINFFAPPSIPGVGQSNGLSLELLTNNGDVTPNQLFDNLEKFLASLNADADFSYSFSTFTADTPHIYLDIDRTKLESYQIPVSSLFSALQSNLGSRYVNNITLSGQVNDV
ncbi:MAG: efflux RND transporter permease subunit, partial [Alphaproteobacteria bacterium]|nr:efflux RND transporter permease subunit [Alphaproteobacteria bacterium]